MVRCVIELDSESCDLIDKHQGFVDKWVRGLRSGRYSQTHNAMVDRNKVNSACCLMVMEIECNGRDWSDHLDISDLLSDMVAGKPSDLFGGVGWCQQLNAVVTEQGKRVVRASPIIWNDHLKLTFEQIADLLSDRKIEVDLELRRFYESKSSV